MNGIKLRQLTYVNRKFEITESFFDNIDTDEKAYFLGFLYADGCVKDKKNMVILALKESDKEILEKLNRLIHKDKPLYIAKDKREGNRENTVGIRICNKHVVNKLIELGCYPRKTFILEYPAWLDKKLYGSFIRGYFDGDGSISMRYFTGKSPQLKFTLTGNGKFLRYVQKIIKEELNVNSSIEVRHKDRNNDIISIVVTGGIQLEKLYDFLYCNSSIYLERKHELFKIVKTRIKKNLKAK